MICLKFGFFSIKLTNQFHHVNLNTTHFGRFYSHSTYKIYIFKATTFSNFTTLYPSTQDNQIGPPLALMILITDLKPKHLHLKYIE
jgi:hypothetical protein